MNASIHLTHSFAFSAFSMEVSSTAVGFENGKNLKLIFEKNVQKRNNEWNLCFQKYTHKIVDSSAMHYTNIWM